MELEYVLKAVRRFWPVVVCFALLGAVAGYLLKPSASARYESTALVLVVPAATSGTQGGDRYVASQLVIMRSPPLADRAEALAGIGEIQPDDVTFEQIAGTDVVRIDATAGSPGDAQKVANSYLDAYLERRSSDSGAATSEEAEQVRASIAEVEGQLSEINAQIQTVMKPYNDAALLDPQVVIPAVVQVAPALDAQREVLLDTYRNLLQQQNSLEFDQSTQDVDSQIVQSASLPLEPTLASRRLLRLAVPVLGVLLGVAAATVLARLSRRVLDATEAHEVLQLPFAGRLPNERALRAGALAQIGALPAAYDERVREVCVQVDARAELDTPLTIAVTGAQRESGATTLAAAMAARFGELGSAVLLVDLDLEDPDISRHVDVRGDGLADLLGAGATRNGDRTGSSLPFTPTPWPNVRVLGRAPDAAGGRPQRADFLEVMQVASRHAGVVVLDVGPMLAAPAAAVVSQRAEVVVLTIPVQQQDRTALSRVAQQLGPTRSKVLPVETSVGRRTLAGLLPRSNADRTGTDEREPARTGSGGQRDRAQSSASGQTRSARGKPPTRGESAPKRGGAQRDRSRR